MEVQHFLSVVGLEKHAPAFAANGLAHLEDLGELTADEYVKLGVTDPSEQQHISDHVPRGLQLQAQRQRQQRPEDDNEVRVLHSKIMSVEIQGARDGADYCIRASLCVNRSGGSSKSGKVYVDASRGSQTKSATVKNCFATWNDQEVTTSLRFATGVYAMFFIIRRNVFEKVVGFVSVPMRNLLTIDAFTTVHAKFPIKFIKKYKDTLHGNLEMSLSIPGGAVIPTSRSYKVLGVRMKTRMLSLSVLDCRLTQTVKSREGSPTSVTVSPPSSTVSSKRSGSISKMFAGFTRSVSQGRAGSEEMKLPHDEDRSGSPAVCPPTSKYSFEISLGETHVDGFRYSGETATVASSGNDAQLAWFETFFMGKELQRQKLVKLTLRQSKTGSFSAKLGFTPESKAIGSVFVPVAFFLALPDADVVNKEFPIRAEGGTLDVIGNVRLEVRVVRETPIGYKKPCCDVKDTNVKILHSMPYRTMGEPRVSEGYDSCLGPDPNRYATRCVMDTSFDKQKSTPQGKNGLATCESEPCTAEHAGGNELLDVSWTANDEQCWKDGVQRSAVKDYGSPRCVVDDHSPIVKDTDADVTVMGNEIASLRSVLSDSKWNRNGEVVI